MGFCNDMCRIGLYWMSVFVTGYRINQYLTLFLQSPSKANSLAGLPSGILYILNQCRVAWIKPGICFSTSSISVTSNRERERELVKFMLISHQISPTLFFYHSTCRQEDHVNQWPGPSNRFLLHPTMPWYPMLSLAWLRLVYQRMNQFRIHQSDHCRHVLAYLDVSLWDLPKSKDQR